MSLIILWYYETIIRGHNNFKRFISTIDYFNLKKKTCDKRYYQVQDGVHKFYEDSFLLSFAAEKNFNI